jgi:hypothetical protein
MDPDVNYLNFFVFRNDACDNEIRKKMAHMNQRFECFHDFSKFINSIVLITSKKKINSREDLF